MKTRLALAVALMALTCPSAASAAVPGAWQQKALETAQRVWKPACGPLTLKFGDPASFGGIEAIGGWAWTGNCEIGINAAAHWPGYTEFCQTVLHEAGHVTGRGHSETGIMRAVFPSITVAISTVRGRRIETWSDADPRCLPQRARRRVAPHVRYRGV